MPSAKLVEPPPALELFTATDMASPLFSGYYGRIRRILTDHAARDVAAAGGHPWLRLMEHELTAPHPSARLGVNECLGQRVALPAVRVCRTPQLVKALHRVGCLLGAIRDHLAQAWLCKDGRTTAYMLATQRLHNLAALCACLCMADNAGGQAADTASATTTTSTATATPPTAATATPPASPLSGDGGGTPLSPSRDA